MKILIAIDGSEISEDLLHVGAELPLDSKELTVCTVVNLLETNKAETGEALHSSIDNYNKMIRQESLQRLGNAKSFISQKFGVEPNTHLIDGDPRTSLNEYAESIGAGLIVIGATGHSALLNLVLGSVSRSVLEQSSCSVLVVSQKWPDAQNFNNLHLGIAFDNSEASRRSCGFLKNFQSEALKKIDIYHYCPFASYGTYGSHVPDPPAPGLYPEYDTNIDYILNEGEALVQEFVGEGAVNKHAFYGVTNIAKHFVDQSDHDKCNLLVLGNNGKSAVARFFLGTVSRKVAALASHLTLIVK